MLPIQGMIRSRGTPRPKVKGVASALCGGSGRPRAVEHPKSHSNRLVAHTPFRHTFQQSRLVAHTPFRHTFQQSKDIAASSIIIWRKLVD